MAQLMLQTRQAAQRDRVARDVRDFRRSMRLFRATAKEFNRMMREWARA